MNENTNMNQEEYLNSLLNGANNVPQDSAVNILGGTAPSTTNAPTVETTDANTQSVDASTITTETEIINPEEVVIKDIDNTDVADLLSSIDDYSSYITDNVSKIEEFNQNLDQIIFPETHLENYLSLEEYYKVEKNLPFGEKKFEDLTDEERNNVAFLYRRDMQFDRNKIINIIRDKYQNHRNEFVNNIAAKTKQTSRLVESFVHEMNSKKEALELKVKWALEDMESLERERTTVGTSFERAQEILEEQRKLQKEIDNNKALISNYNGLISLGNSYGTLASTINAKVADNKLDLTNDLKDLNSIYDTIKKARKNADVVETKAAVEEEPTVSETIEAPVEEVKEETKEAPAEEPKEEVVEEKKEETPENLQTVENPPAVVEQPVKEEESEIEMPEEKTTENKPGFETKGPGSNGNIHRVTADGARKRIANKRRCLKEAALAGGVFGAFQFGTLAAAGLFTPGIGIPLAVLAGTIGGATFGGVAPTLGIAGVTKLMDTIKVHALNWKMASMANRFGLETFYDYDNQKMYFGKYVDSKLTPISKKEDVLKSIKGLLMEEDPDKYKEDLEKKENEEDSEEKAIDKDASAIYTRYVNSFNKMINKDQYVTQGKSFESLLESNNLGEVYNRFGGIKVADDLIDRKHLNDADIDMGISASKKVLDENIKKLKALLENKEKYNLSDTVKQLVEEAIDRETKILNYKKNPETLKEAAISKVSTKLGDIKNRVLVGFGVKNNTEVFTDEEKVEDVVENTEVQTPAEATVENVETQTQAEATVENVETQTPVEIVDSEERTKILNEDPLEQETPVKEQTEAPVMQQNFDYSGSYAGTTTNMNHEDEGFVQDFTPTINELENEKFVLEQSIESLTEEERKQLESIELQLNVLRGMQEHEDSKKEDRGMSR